MPLPPNVLRFSACMCVNDLRPRSEHHREDENPLLPRDMPHMRFDLELEVPMFLVDDAAFNEELKRAGQRVFNEFIHICNRKACELHSERE